MKEVFILTVGMIASALKSGLNSLMNAVLIRHFMQTDTEVFDEILPWDHIDYGVTKDFLIRECKKCVRRYNNTALQTEMQ